MAVVTLPQKIKEVLERGVEEVIDRGHLEQELKSGRQLRMKLGFDPTGTKIHIGRAIVLRKLRAFQDLGHKAVFIVGDFTARIGDPSDKLSKRPMLSASEVKENLKNYKKQIGRIIDLKKAEFHFNGKWLKKLGLEEMGDLAESFSIQQMLKRRNFSERIKKDEEISLREMFYPLMQGYDSVAVKADVELGGFDQLFNLKAGRVIQRHYGQKEQDILICEMLEGTDGRKMSTSWGNVINITDEPNDMFGKIMSVRDELIGKYFLLCTDIDEKEIEKIGKAIEDRTINPKDAKLRLAKEIVAIYHGEKASQKAENEWDRVFHSKELPSEMKTFKVGGKNINIVDLLVATELATSKGEARRLIEQGGIKIDEHKILDHTKTIEISSAGHVLQVGKRHFVKVVV